VKVELKAQEKTFVITLNADDAKELEEEYWELGPFRTPTVAEMVSCMIDHPDN